MKNTVIGVYTFSTALEALEKLLNFSDASTHKRISSHMHCVLCVFIDIGAFFRFSIKEILKNSHWNLKFCAQNVIF